MSNIMKTKPRALDLFCGCGGISSGLESAGFEVIAGVDVEPKYLQTFKENFPRAQAIKSDLSKVSPVDFMRSLGIGPGELDLLAGGPPCQGFSKNVPRSRREVDSKNNMLIDTFLTYCEALKPRLIMMENVAEMKNGYGQEFTEKVVERLSAVGYALNHEVLNGADYGVPQKRRRAFFIASLKKMPVFLAPTHAKENKSDVLFPLKKHVTVWDAIGDLPSLSHGQDIDPFEYRCNPFSEFQEKMRTEKGKVKNTVARLLKPLQFERISSLSPGQGLKDLPEHLRPKSGYSGAYGRLAKDMVAPTITRWVFHPGSGRWGHPEDVRLITIREAARLQSFPDHFEFVGSYNDHAGQIGNAVPPLLAEIVAKSLLRVI